MPSSNPSSSAPPTEESLDDEQRAAVFSAQPAIAVLAGPGSGKTRTLSFRTRHLLGRDNDSAALLLTFTNKAAAEMKARAIGVTGLSKTRIHASTFHAFCVEVLRAHGDLVGVARDFEIDHDGCEAIAIELTGTLDLYREWGASRLRRQPAREEVETFGARFQAAKSKASIVDFDDLVIGTALLFEKVPNVARAYSAKYQHILVDEFQDTNAVQFAIVQALAPYAASVSIFADDDQAIFGFAGAETENVNRFVELLGATKYPLTVNYRSGAEIVRCANALIGADPSSSGRLMKAHREGGAVRFVSSTTAEEEAQVLGAEIAGAISAGDLPSDLAVLVRSKYRADTIMRELRGRGLPVSDWRTAQGFSAEHRALATCLATVRGALRPKQVAQLCELMGVSESDDTETEALLAAHAGNPLADGLAVVRNLAFEGATPFSIARQAQLALKSVNVDLAARLDPLIDSVASFELYDKDFTLEHLLAELALGTFEGSPSKGGGIKVATLHRTKGLQWKHVYLVGLEQGHHPHPSADFLEERRLCFVGVSRAEEHLTVTYAAKTGWSSRERSAFLAEIGFQ